jgi:hypothetical protein
MPAAPPYSASRHTRFNPLKSRATYGSDRSAHLQPHSDTCRCGILVTLYLFHRLTPPTISRQSALGTQLCPELSHASMTAVAQT